MIEDAAGTKADKTFEKAHEADMEATWASIDKARDLVGWEPEITLEEGVRRTVEWYEDSREWVKELELGHV